MEDARDKPSWAEKLPPASLPSLAMWMSEMESSAMVKPVAFIRGALLPRLEPDMLRLEYISGMVLLLMRLGLTCVWALLAVGRQACGGAVTLACGSAGTTVASVRSPMD